MRQTVLYLPWPFGQHNTNRLEPICIMLPKVADGCTVWSAACRCCHRFLKEHICSSKWTLVEFFIQLCETAAYDKQHYTCLGPFGQHNTNRLILFVSCCPRWLMDVQFCLPRVASVSSFQNTLESVNEHWSSFSLNWMKQQHAANSTILALAPLGNTTQIGSFYLCHVAQGGWWMYSSVCHMSLLSVVSQKKTLSL